VYKLHLLETNLISYTLYSQIRVLIGSYVSNWCLLCGVSYVKMLWICKCFQ